MLAFTRQAVPTRLARSFAPKLCLSSSDASNNALSAPAVPARSKRPDPALEKRRAARLAREAATVKHPQARTNRSSAAPASSDKTLATRSPNHPPKSNSPHKGRPRKPSRRDQAQSSSDRGTERSRLEATKPGAAEAIMAISRNEAAKRAARQKANPLAIDPETDPHVVQDPPQSVHPESPATDIAAFLNTVPGYVACLPSIPPSQKLRQVSAKWVKQVYGGDYSQYEVDRQFYMEGAQGSKPTYAQIILERNRSIPLESQKRLINAVQKVTDRISARL